MKVTKKRKEKDNMKFEDKLIEVCDKCKQASCWHGTFFCDEASYAGTELIAVRDLRKLNNEKGFESEDYWSDETLKKICGHAAPHGWANMKE